MKFPVFSQLAGNFGFRDGFARDSLLQRGVCCEPRSRRSAQAASVCPIIMEKITRDYWLNLVWGRFKFYSANPKSSKSSRTRDPSIDPHRRDKTQPRLPRQGFQASRLPANHHRDALDLRIHGVAVDKDLGHDGVLAGRQP